MRTIRKTSGEEKIETLDWSEIRPDYITGSTWTFPLASLEEGTSDFSAWSTEVEIKGGVSNEEYTVTNRVTTQRGAVLVKSFHVIIRPLIPEPA
jgi:hypothetical protein